MDLIRIFIDTAFSGISDYFLKEIDSLRDVRNMYIPDEDMFVDICRRSHPELTDDQIRMVYGLYRDEWGFSDEDLERYAVDHKFISFRPEIFNVLFRFSKEMIRLNDNEPVVKFNHLFRWRETTLNIGEDILTAAFYAYRNRNIPFIVDTEIGISESSVDGIDFCSWPSILHNDNPHLRYIFRKHRLTELHSHLYASADNFAISWTALMNSIKERKENFRRLAQSHNKSRAEKLADELHSFTVMACAIRLKLWRKLNGSDSPVTVEFRKIASAPERVAFELHSEIVGEYRGRELYDYVVTDIESPLCVVGGERKFLYCTLRWIQSRGDEDMSFLLYRYLLAKNRLRSFMVQVNDNRGFANFQRFQNLKTVFLNRKYKPLLSRLAVWEAATFNYTDVFETRIAPSGNFRETRKRLKREERNISGAFDEGGEPQWSLLFHFIKRPENLRYNNPDSVDTDLPMRDEEVRKRVKGQSVILKNLLTRELWLEADKSWIRRVKGIDAASSEIGCRPEIFAQAFRYLKDAGYAATFHAGEDFYDLADGLRAISEAIFFLGLEAGDRIGHALALGIDPDDFYGERHNHIALPLQWMLDNVVWLYFKCRKGNVSIEPETEDFLLSTFRTLVRRIGYERKDEKKVEITDYYQSMRLRGDAPEIYQKDELEPTNSIHQAWRHYDRMDNAEVNEIRVFNRNARELYNVYLWDPYVRAQGQKIASFRVPSGYPHLIRGLQEEMIRFVSKSRMGIECCPSSNYRIGYFKKYEAHPIFRFFPVRDDRTQYPLPVTVNTDDLGVFATSLPNEYSLLTLALMKMKDSQGNHVYSGQEVYSWIERVIMNNEKYAFGDID